MRDWSAFQSSKRTRRRKAVSEGSPLPRIADLVMEHVPGTPSEKLDWLQRQIAEGRLDGDDPEEIGQAKALLEMLIRISGSMKGAQQGHLDELLDEGLKGTFPASDPVTVGHFTATEPPARPVDRTFATDVRGTRSRKKEARVRRYG